VNIGKKLNFRCLRHMEWVSLFLTVLILIFYLSFLMTPKVSASNDVVKSGAYLHSPFGSHPASVSHRGYRRNPFADAMNIGIRWTRESLYAYWFLVQKDLNEDIYDFSQLDEQFRRIPKSINILANIAPQGLFDEGRCLGGSWLPINKAKYEAFVQATVERYDGDGIKDMPGLTNPIHYWQVGNEPDFVSPRFASRTNFSSLQRITYQAIKAANVLATVLLGGVAGPPFHYIARFDNRFAPILKELGGRYVDVFDFHWYGRADGDYRLRDKITEESVLEHIRAKLAHYGFPRTIPIWITEMGSYSGNPRGKMFPQQTERQQASDYFKRYIYSLSHGVKKIFLAMGMMEGFKPIPNDYFDHTGLIYDGQYEGDLGLGVKKLAYYTYKKMTECLESADWTTMINLRDGTKSDHLYLFSVMKKNYPIYVAWWDYFDEPIYTNGATKSITLTNLAGEAIVVTAVVPTAKNGRDVGNYHSAFQTTVCSVSNGSATISLGKDPVFIEPVHGQ